MDNQSWPAGTVGADGVPEIAGVYDTNTGEYKVKPLRDVAFCS